MTKYILIGGYIWKAPDGGKALCEEFIKDLNKSPIKILDCMFARPKESWEDKLEEDRIFFSKYINNVSLEMADPDFFVEQVKSADIIYLKGGETKPLIDILNKNPGWADELDGKVLAGSSAGGDVMAKYYAVGKTGRISGEGLGLLPIKFIPHWQSETFDEYDIAWDKLYEGLKAYKEDLPIHTLKEGEFEVIWK